LVAHFKDGVKLTLGVEMDYGLHDETGNPSCAARDSLYSIWGDLIDNDVVDAETLDKHCEEHTLHVLIEMYYPPCVCEEVLVGGKVLNVYSTT
jgi:hypothetical protein